MLEYDSVRQAAFQMSIGDRLRLIDELAAALPDDQPPSLSSEWLEEIGRRSAEIDSGAVATEPWPQIRQRVFNQLGLNGVD
jgi:putative addiction module component (TIGR02574 family)